jgi:hypothetical protein
MLCFKTLLQEIYENVIYSISFISGPMAYTFTLQEKGRSPLILGELSEIVQQHPPLISSHISEI